MPLLSEYWWSHQSSIGPTAANSIQSCQLSYGILLDVEKKPIIFSRRVFASSQKQTYKSQHKYRLTPSLSLSLASLKQGQSLLIIRPKLLKNIYHSTSHICPTVSRRRTPLYNMPPKQSTATGSKPRGRPPSKTGTKSHAGDATTKKTSAAHKSRSKLVDEDEPEDDEPIRGNNSSDVEMVGVTDKEKDQDVDEFASDGEDEQPKRIPPELLRRLLHEAFDKDTTRVSKEANAAVARYFDIFVQEAIARTAAERNGRFLEVRFYRFPLYPCLSEALYFWPWKLLDANNSLTCRYHHLQVEDLEKVAPQLLLDL